MACKMLLASAKFTLLSPQVQSNNCNLFQIAVKFYFHFLFPTTHAHLIMLMST